MPKRCPASGRASLSTVRSRCRNSSNPPAARNATRERRSFGRTAVFKERELRVSLIAGNHDRPTTDGPLSHSHYPPASRVHTSGRLWPFLARRARHDRSAGSVTWLGCSLRRWESSGLRNSRKVAEMSLSSLSTMLSPTAFAPYRLCMECESPEIAAHCQDRVSTQSPGFAVLETIGGTLRRDRHRQISWPRTRNASISTRLGGCCSVPILDQ